MYRAFANEFFKGDVPKPLLVGDSPLTPLVGHQYPGDLTGLERLHRITGLPAGLAERVDSLARPPRGSEILELPTGMRVVPPEEFARLNAVRPPSNPDALAVGQMGFSRVAYTADGQQALLVFSWNCGGRCGQLGAAWLALQPDRTWRVVVVQAWLIF